MPKPVSLRSRSDFLRVQQKGRRFKGRYGVLIVAPCPHAETRVGYTVSRKVGNAVVRNRVRRRLREIIRGHAHALCQGMDHVVVAFNEAPSADYASLRDEVLWLLSRANEWASRKVS